MIGSDYMKKIFYEDELNDDFAATQGIKTKPLPKDYKWIHTSRLWNFFADILYYLIAYPLVKIFNTFVVGLRIKNKRVIKKLKTGCFLYSNHTQHIDPLISATVSGWGHRTYFMAGNDAFSIRGLSYLVAMLGAMPLGYDIASMKKMLQTVSKRIHENACITIYPEAHIWPYYTGIRPFKSASFAYPVALNAPVVASVVTYRKRHWPFRCFFRHPAITVYCSDPMYANPTLSKKAAKEDLRNRVYDWMKETADKYSTYEFWHYEKKNVSE